MSIVLSMRIRWSCQDGCGSSCALLCLRAREQVKEAKGLDMVRRDWCGLAKDCGNYCLDTILSERPCEDVVDAIHAKLHEARPSVAPARFGTPPSWSSPVMQRC